MRTISLSIALIFLGFSVLGQSDCPNATPVCSNGASFPLAQAGMSQITAGSNISNPPLSPVNNIAGSTTKCLVEDGRNASWFTFYIKTSGMLQFKISNLSNNGPLDWALWPYNVADPSTTCAQITTLNSLPPVACNWNTFPNGCTGMWNSSTPPSGGQSNNFTNSIPVNVGEAYILCLSNTYDVPGNFTFDFNPAPGIAEISCEVIETEDQTICEGNSAIVDILAMGAPVENVTWLVTTGVSDIHGISGVVVTPTVTTDYIVEYYQNGVKKTDQFTIYVMPSPIPSFIVDEPIKCEPAQFTLTNTTDPTTFNSSIWRIGNKDNYYDQPVLTTNSMKNGIYDVELVVISSNGCADSVLINSYLMVNVQPIADFRYTPDPVTIYNSQVTFAEAASGEESYDWTFPGGSPAKSNSSHPVINYPEGISTEYHVTLKVSSDLGCEDSITKTIRVEPEVLLYAPNSFTPNGDEYNQNWFVCISGIDVYNFELLIYDRWGEIIWESLNPEVGWDGTTYNGKIVPTGSYTWTIRSKDMLNDKKYEWSGHVNVLR